jgi:segregation and condensation protein A
MGKMTNDANPKENLTLGGSAAALEKAMEGSASLSTESKLKSDDYRVHIPVFDGPLDLLLHLIRKDQLNIYDIPIAQICRSYVDYLDVMQTPDVNLAGEFMVMAATLTQMKSAMLLPRDESDDEADDPRAPLVAALLEYEQFKRAADDLDQRPWLYRDIFIRPPVLNPDALMAVESLMDAPIDPIDTFQLLLCLKAALNRTTRPPLQISTDPTSIKERSWP